MKGSRRVLGLFVVIAAIEGLTSQSQAQGIRRWKWVDVIIVPDCQYPCSPYVRVETSTVSATSRRDKVWQEASAQGVF